MISNRGPSAYQPNARPNRLTNPPVTARYAIIGGAPRHWRVQDVNNTAAEESGGGPVGWVRWLR